MLKFIGATVVSILWHGMIFYAGHVFARRPVAADEAVIGVMCLSGAVVSAVCVISAILKTGEPVHD